MSIIDNLPSIIAASTAIGTAAYGLVDAHKVVWGGVSNAGFGYIRTAVDPLLPDGQVVLPKAQVIETLHANWLNGMPKADQKAAAKSLIRLRLDENCARALAMETGVSPEALVAVTTKIAAGTALDQTDLNALGRFDAVLSARLDAAYERADQLYRNAAKALASVIGLLLAWLAAVLSNMDMRTATLVGIIAAPVAPIAKDASSALVQAVSAMRGIRR